MKQLLKDLGNVIRERRIELGYSQEILANKSGLHRTYISDVELGKRNLTFLNLIAIINALELSVSDFFQTLSSQSNALR